MGRYIFLDLETKQAIDKHQNISANNLDISLSVTYDYQAGYRVWMERDSAQLINYLITFDYVVGFNLINFDYEVLSQYDNDDLLNELEDKTIDLLFLIELEIGKRVSLQSLATETLDCKKMNNGLDAIQYWRKRQIHRLIDYCKEDVRITRLLFEFIQRHGFVYYSSSSVKKEIKLTLPNDARSIQLDLHEYKVWFDIFMESLMLADTISTKQISILRNKTIDLIDSFESKIDEFEFIWGRNNSGSWKRNDDYDIYDEEEYEEEYDDEEEEDDEDDEDEDEDEDDHKGRHYISPEKHEGDLQADDLPF